MSDIRTWEALENILKQKVQKAMYKEGEFVVKKVKEHIDSDVYNVYSPKKYERTFELRDSVVSKSPDIKNNIVEVEIKHNTNLINSNSPNQHYSIVKNYEPKDVSDWIPWLVHEGKTYPLFGGDIYTERRPYMDNTFEELEHSKEHVEILKSALRKDGLIVE